MARIQHPRASDKFARDPPSSVAVPVGGDNFESVDLDDDHYFEVADEHAEETMEALASSYDVEYDDDGNVVSASEGDSESSAEELEETFDDMSEPLSDEGEDEAEGEDEQEGPPDVDEWDEWNEDDWLEMDFRDRARDVREGRVDDHLDEIKEADGSTTVETAVDERQSTLNEEE